MLGDELVRELRAVEPRVEDIAVELSSNCRAGVGAVVRDGAN